MANPASVPQSGVVAAVVSAMGGLGLGIATSRTEAGAGGAAGGATGGAGRGTGQTAVTRTKQVGRAVAHLGGFAAAVQEHGLADALRGLDLGDLDGRPAVEIVARVADHLASGVDGIDGELLRKALSDAILEAAALQEQLGFTDLEAALQTFLDEQGLGGLLELFLSRLVSDLVTAAILDHLGQKTDSDMQTEALLSGIDIVCRDKARSTVEHYRATGRFNQVDWFGTAGARLGRELAEALLADLRTT